MNPLLLLKIIWHFGQWSIIIFAIGMGVSKIIGVDFYLGFDLSLILAIIAGIARWTYLKKR